MSVHRPDALAGLRLVKIGPGEMHLTTDPDEAIVTVLGSCVAACLRDPVARVGGMNHFMLPEADEDNGSWQAPDARLRYGNIAMAALVEGIQRQGGQVRRMEAKLFGAGRIGPDPGQVGASNAHFAEAFLRGIGLVPLVRDLGGSWARRLAYHPATGRAFLSELRDKVTPSPRRRSA